MDRQSIKRVAIKAWHPHWKEKFRESCLQRVKKERNRLLWKIRSAGKSLQVCRDVTESAFRHILSDEITRPKQTSGSQHSCGGTDCDSMLWEYELIETLSELSQEDYEELMIAMENILHEEMHTKFQEKEATLLNDFDNTCAQEDDCLATLLGQLQGREDGLLCPICKVGNLDQIQHLIYCSCGHLRLDVQHEKVNLEFLRGRLEELLQQHYEIGCRSQPFFCTDNRFSVTALYMQCSSCEMFELVL